MKVEWETAGPESPAPPELACQRCGAADDDLRTLWHSCLYDMAELGLPFEERSLEGRTHYVLRVCKLCRSDWLHALGAWFDQKPEPPPPEADIPIRDLGATRLVTDEEYARLFPGRTPYRLRDLGEES